jgi:hypothetical protein
MLLSGLVTEADVARSVTVEPQGKRVFETSQVSVDVRFQPGFELVDAGQQVNVGPMRFARVCCVHRVEELNEVVAAEAHQLATHGSEELVDYRVSVSDWKTM